MNPVMNPDTFIFIVSSVIFVQILILFGKETVENIYKLKPDIVTVFVIIYIIATITFKYALFKGNKTLLEIPHLFMNLSVIFTSLFILDERILYINIVLLTLTVFSRLYYNGCAINMVGNKEKTFIPDFLNNLLSYIERKTNINWTHIYSLLLIVNIYKLYMIM
jgi:hypothetical protein